MNKLFLLVLAQIIMDPLLRGQAAQSVAEFLANTLPDVTEDAIGAFLDEVGDKLTADN